ncbi:MAG: hypothetical protein FE78DRAFT_34353 [Acidomyces sp. 'richmondensis']|nr:MAG: hypothetical protein FE78DRAFT_34353 [Acidomyces sp. 'richmondensis']
MGMKTIRQMSICVGSRPRTPLAYTNALKTLENETRAALRRSQQTSGLSSREELDTLRNL